MAKNLIEYSAATADIVSYANYDSAKTVLGPDIRQFTGSSSSEYWIGPPPTRFQDPTQDTGLSNWGDIDAITYSGSKQWVFALRGFAANNGNAEIAAWEFDKDTYEYTYKGRTTVTPPSVTAGTWQGIKSNLEYYSTGSVEVNGTSVTGSGTDFIADRIPVGARIGFGSTNPSDITTWYRIASYPAMTLKTGFNALVYTTAVDASGSLYVGGNFTSYSGSAVNRIVKLTPSGSIDTSFNPGVGFNSFVNVIRIDSSGSIYVGGNFTSYSGSTNNYIIKLNPDGTKDTSFDNSTGFNGAPNEIQFDSTGSLWVGGGFTTYKGASTPFLAKLLTTGLRDTSYVTTNSPNTTVNTVAVDANDDVYIGGVFTQVGATANNSRNIAKILKTGGLDASFVVGVAGTSNAFDSSVNAIHYKTATNSIVVGGAFTQWKGVGGNASLVELSAVGNIIKGTSSVVVVQSMTPDSSGSLYVNCNLIVSKYDLATLTVTNSSTSPTFCPNITYGALNSFLYRPSLSLDGSKLYVGSSNTTVDAGLVVVDTTYGNHDVNFATTPDYVSQVLTLNSSAGTLPPGTPYVIENLQFSCVSSVTANSIGFIQGLSWDDFTVIGTTITLPALDYAALNKGFYRLNDRGYSELVKGYRITTNLSGLNDSRILPKQNEDITHLYVRGTSNNFVRLNLKDSQLRIHGNSATQASIAFNTATQIISPNSLGINNFTSGKFTIDIMQTGSASGSYSIFADRNNPAGIVQINVNELLNEVTPPSTQMEETPPGSSLTIPTAGNVGRVYYMSTIDRLIVLNASATAKSYITNYRTDLQFPTLTGTLYGRDTFNQLAIDNSYDLAFLGNFNQLQGNTANSNAPRYPDTLGTGFFGAVENGVLHLCRPLNTIQNNMYAMPLECEATYVDFSKNAFYTPKFSLSNIVSITGLHINSLKQYGNPPFNLPPEPIVIYYRTTGIDDDSGSWRLYNTVDELNQDIACEGVLDNLEIQFRFSYRVAGNTCLPNRIYGFTLVYEDDRTDSHYAPSVAKSDLTNRIFAWQQVEPWYGNIPELKIRLYNATNNKIVYYDTTATNVSGTWQYSTDGTTWLAWDNTADAVGNYIRYVADFIPSGIKLRVGLNKI
jgi:hypothetical protein